MLALDSHQGLPCEAPWEAGSVACGPGSRAVAGLPGSVGAVAPRCRPPLAVAAPGLSRPGLLVWRVLRLGRRRAAKVVVLPPL